VESVAAQTLSDWECVIVDDCSDDRTSMLLSELRRRDARIVTHRMPVRSGNTLTRAEACRLARGEFLAVLDDDDWWEPAKLEQQVAALQAAPSSAWSYHAAQLVSPAGRGEIEPVRHGHDFLQRLVQYNWLRHSSMIFRRSAFDAVGGYDTRLRLASDWDLVLRLTLRFGQETIVTLPEALVNYWQHPGAISTNSAVRTRAERRLVRRALVHEGMLWRKPGLALRMLDRQLDREMHCAQAEQRRIRAAAAAGLSALARPFRLWRWQRAASFAANIFARRQPGAASARQSPLAASTATHALAHAQPAVAAMAVVRIAEPSSAAARAREYDGPPVRSEQQAESPSRASQREYA
jgi:hypothetical protein